MTPTFPRYDRHRSYRWNYDHPPRPVDVEDPAIPGDWTFCGLPARSPLGIPAGPLLNGAWCLYYASLGFDVLTYKTVRSGARDCYPLPNLAPVACPALAGGEREVPACDQMQGSWAVSYGMPSQPPEVWQEDVRRTRAQLPAEKRLVVSVVATVQEGWGVAELAADYAECAARAVASGADAVETNFSCPNVSTSDGQLFQHPAAARQVAEAVRDRIGNTPYLVKIGWVPDARRAAELLDAVGPSIQGLAMTNSIATQVRGADGQMLFQGERRGICGDAIRHASIRQVAMFSELIGRRGWPIEVVGVGGAATLAHVRDYLAAGAAAVHLATSAMVDPAIGLEIKRQWLARSGR